MSRCGNILAICLICSSGWLQMSCLMVTGQSTRAHDAAPEAQQKPVKVPHEPRPPQIADDSIDVSIRSQSSRQDRVYVPILELAFVGDSKTDDRVLLQYSLAGKPIGSVLDCAVEPARAVFGTTRRERWKGKIACYAKPEQVSLPGPGVYDLDLTYKLTAEGTEVKWRHITFEAADYYDGPGDRKLRVDLDRDLYRGWITFTDPKRYSYDECSGIPTLDMHVLVSPVRTRREPEPKVVVGRCYVNGKQVGEDLTTAPPPSGYSVGDTNSEEVFEYLVVRIATNFSYLAPDQLKCLKKPGFAAGPRRDHFLVTHPGQWDCKITIDGKLARVVHFAVDANGQIPLHAEQTGEGALVFADPATRFVDVEIVGDFDREAARRRLGGTAFFGRPWKTPRLQATAPGAPVNP